MNQNKPRVPLCNIANILTIIRLVLVPAFIVSFLVDDPAHRWWAVGIFFVAASTDKLDGYFARAWNLITDFGKLADSIADKALIISALLLLSWHGYLWWWVTIVFIVRELGITLLRMNLRKVKVMAAGWHGKVKMAAQSLAIGGLLLPWHVFLPQSLAVFLVYVSYSLMGIALFYALLSAFEYVRDAMRLLKNAAPENH
ncbi:CDP-diacylglycerol--glycerol-3-phosphate 3-phosphatidyltransferase [Arcanobacterium hippocoleae]|uniref:CDP-diacylglycerol--glycerol-3-phosphate 3-phosphatidyltransferase n=1 Tax=Arcanobacterium hippocoleae TaxID=149017 RepID=A0ABU1T2C7_9ACTO|nr:CDP-diacylglycerol--glycerol-3-phosphate 3-phosphatidyltransferase [Arcanobacterium hippocoleae]MDR6939031.1 CDP-diacylglycerol--glycerol-3-phosphate 3-phosphatidyltransferase [Arcanobacterium hippocoleae]